MTTTLFANNAKTTLAAAVSTVDTTISVFAGTGSLFPIPDPTPVFGTDFVATITDATTGLINEIVTVTAVSDDTFTVIRGQENTTARAWAIGDILSNFPTAGTMNDFVQSIQLQRQYYSLCTGFGTVNAITASLPSTTGTPTDGLRVILHASGGNTSTVTFDLTLGSGHIGIRNVVKGDNIPLEVGDIPAAGYLVELLFNALNNNWVMQNPATDLNVIAGVPVGAIFQFASPQVPTGYLTVNGQLVSRTTYVNLYNYAVSSGNIVSDATWNAGQKGSFSTGDGSTTFRMPLFSGYFVRAYDNGQGIDPGRVFGTVQSGQNATHTHAATSSSSSNTSIIVNDPGHVHSQGLALTGLWNGGSAPAVGNGGNQFSGSGASNIGVGGTPYPTNRASTGIGISATTATTTTTTNASQGGSEVRPANIVVQYGIKY